MEWIKLGVLFVPNNNHEWMYSHASNPVAEHLINNVFRIYFNSRNRDNQSHIGYVDVNIEPGNIQIKAIAKYPVLSPGETGLFDDSGVSLSCLQYNNNTKYLFYVGWNLGVTVPWRNSIGLAICDNQQNVFNKFKNVPLIDRNEVDPYSLSYPYILKENNLFHMWYGSNLKWGKNPGDMNYVIKYAVSQDLLNWSLTGKICIGSEHSDEYAFARPFVIKENGIYKMWYSYRGNAYKIGYAESVNAIDWIRKDPITGINLSATGWDSEMQCYPFIFDHNNNRYMLYNGNGYGKTGFGLAILK